ncbi:hypothetical protein GF337_18960 [candidate division KSB1 bacterium]|nr:hypothetical protein [candidate division KSB1 bacterium]
MNHKIYISVDMEGITGVIHWDETDEKKPEHNYFKKLMTEETNAAIEAALEAGATEIVVRDAHASARNLVPDMLNENAKLLREWSRGPYLMMEGIDDSFDAVLCIGYHAKAGTPNATLKHTMSGQILDLRVNDQSLPELGWNALIAGYHSVPVIFVSGDRALTEQAHQIFGEIETVAVKEGLGQAALNLHPKRAQRLIKEGVGKAFKRISDFKPLKFSSPYRMELHFKNEDRAFRAEWYPGAKRIGELVVSFECADFMDCLRFFMFVT